LKLRELQAWNIGYHWKKWVDEPIRNPKNRFVLETAITAEVDEALKFMTRVAIDGGGFTAEDSLVELNYTVSYPGAEAQNVHADISPLQNDDCPLATVWLALQEVTLDMGPTEIWPASHILGKTILQQIPPNLIVPKLQSCSYSSDGTQEIGLDFNTSDEVDQQNAEYMQALHALLVSVQDNCEPEYMKLQVGDAVLMDCRVYHRGTANVSDTPRLLLNATFQKHDVLPIRGFTYHIAPSARGRKIRDFIH